MPNKAQKCCCCPDCTVNPGKCCACIPETICLTFTVYGQDPCSGELDWDRTNKRFAGTICGHDILLYFERDSYDQNCYFKLRSTSLGFPEGYEHAWEVGYEIDCETLTASVVADDVTLDIVGVEKVIPTECTGCKCLCECICVTYSAPCCYLKIRACWDEYIQQYIGSGVCGDGSPINVAIGLEPANSGIPYTNYEYDPDDTSCVAVVYVNDENKGWFRPACPLVNGELVFDEGTDDEVTITVECADCAPCPDDCDHCADNGSIIPTCTMCYEVPLLYHVLIQAACIDGGLFQLASNAATTCRWTSIEPVDIGGGNWNLDVEGLDCGDVRLYVTLSDNSVIVYRNINPWGCMCANRMRLSHYETTAVCSDLPKIVCVEPVDHCCAADRTEEIPSTIYATFQSSTACFCSEVGSIPLTWNPATNKWEGSGRFGECDSSLGGQRTATIKLNCNSQLASGVDAFEVEVTLSGEFCSFSDSAINPTGTCEPLDLEFGPFNTDDCCDLTGGPGNAFAIIISE
jgi:hypothetical protein